MFKEFAKAVWERVVVNYGPTLKGIGVGVAFLVVDQFVQWVGALPEVSPWLKAAAAVAALIGAALKSKQPA